MEEVKEDSVCNEDSTELTPEQLKEQKKQLRKINKQEKKLERYHSLREIKKKQRNERVRAKRKRRGEMFSSMTEGIYYFRRKTEIQIRRRSSGFYVNI